MPAVVVDQLVVRYGVVVAVDGLSFEASSGEVTVLLGPNGAGKTSTIECLEGYLSPTSGTVRIEALDPMTDHVELSRRVGVMLQNGGVYTAIRPPEVLRLFASYYENPRDTDELLELVGLDHRRRSSWRSLSGGEQQRLSLALAIIGRPTVAFLDEPTAGVDLQGKQLIRTLVNDLRSDGVAVVLTTHDLDEAEVLADRIVIIDAGRVVADGSPAELLTAGDSGQFTFRAIAGLDVDSISATIGTSVTERAPGQYLVAATPTPSGVLALTSWMADHDELLGDLQAGRQRLDDVFMRLTGERSPADDRGSRRRRGRSTESTS